MNSEPGTSSGRARPDSSGSVTEDVGVSRLVGDVGEQTVIFIDDFGGSDRHVADHGALFGRVRIDLGQRATTLPTDASTLPGSTARPASAVAGRPALVG